MRTCFSFLFTLFVLSSCTGNDVQPAPAQPVQPSSSDTFKGRWVTSYFADVNHPDTFLNSKFVLLRYPDTTIKVFLYNADDSRSVFFHLEVDAISEVVGTTVLSCEQNNIDHIVYLLPPDSVVYNCQAQDTPMHFNYFRGGK